MSENTSRHASFSLLRRWAIGFNVVVSAALLFAIVVMVNYLAARHHARFQWAHAGRLALSPLTREVLNSLTNDVQVVRARWGAGLVHLANSVTSFATVLNAEVARLNPGR